MAVQQLSKGGTDGVVIGQSSTDKVGWYGATPTSRLTATTGPASTAAVSITASQWGFSTSTQADALIALVRQLRADGITMGLFT